MVKITIIAVGKIKEKYFRDAISEYSKRLKPYAKLEIIEVEDEMIPNNAGFNTRNQVKLKECERILQYLKEGIGVYSMALEVGGIAMNSEAFADKLETLMLRGASRIQFVIGGSLGLHDKISLHTNISLSFSKMTFPHQLMRVILLEQIYRSFRIMNHEPYHK